MLKACWLSVEREIPEESEIVAVGDERRIFAFSFAVNFPSRTVLAGDAAFPLNTRTPKHFPRILLPRRKKKGAVCAYKGQFQSLL